MSTGTRSRLVALLAVAVGGAMIAGLAVTLPQWATPSAAPINVSTPLPAAPDDYTVYAGSGDLIWAEFPGDGDSGRSGLSLDRGRTWTTLGMTPERSHLTAGAGRLAYFGGDDGMGLPRFLYPTALQHGDWDESWQVAAMGTKAILATNGRLVRAERTTVKVTFAALPKSATRPTHRYAFSADSAQLVRLTTTSGSSDYAAVVDVATGRSVGRLTLPRTSQHRIGGSAVFSLTSSKSGLRLCRQPLPSGRAACLKVAGGDHRTKAAQLHQFGARSIIRDPLNTAPLLVEDGRVTAVALPAGTVSWARDGAGDPTRPLLRVLDAEDHPHHLTVEPDGSTAEYRAVPRVPVLIWSLALSPTILFGDHWANGQGAVEWQRTIGTSGLGDPTAAPGRVTGTSGSRWVVQDDKHRRWAYDHGSRGAAVGEFWGITGPYLLGQDDVSLVNGKKLVTKRPKALFGSLVAERITAPQGQPGYWVAIRDLAGPTMQPVPVKLTDSDYTYGLVRLWGDWIGTTPDNDSALVINWRTGAVLTQPFDLAYLGDGFAVLADPNHELSIWVFATNTVTPLGTGTSELVFDADGDRIAYADADRLYLRTVAGAGLSSPRLLGVLTSGRATRTARWKASIDLTKPLAAGTLVIRDKAGRAVRTLTTPASSTGSLRGISWNGRNTAGKQLRGTYTWELVAAATDGSGQAVAVTGVGPPKGSITVG